jgi:hypothetical protein
MCDKESRKNPSTADHFQMDFGGSLRGSGWGTYDFSFILIHILTIDIATNTSLTMDSIKAN